MNRTNEQTNASQPLDQAGWTPRHVVREACRAGFRARYRASTAVIDALPSWMRTQMRCRIADPSGYPHIVPGASATQRYWRHSYGISSAEPGFWR